MGQATRIEIQDANRCLCPVVLLWCQAGFRTDAAQRVKHQKSIGVFHVRLDEIGVLVGAATVFVSTTGGCTFARTKEVAPVKSALWVATALAKVFYMTMANLNKRLTVGAALALHSVELFPNSAPLGGVRAFGSPGVSPVAVTAQAGGSLWIAVQVVHSGTFTHGFLHFRELLLKRLQPNQSVALVHHRVIASKVGIQVCTQLLTFSAGVQILLDKRVVTR